MGLHAVHVFDPCRLPSVLETLSSGFTGMNPVQVISAGVLAVLLLDTFGSLASRSLGFLYAKLSVVSFSIYFLVGIYAARDQAIAVGAFAGATVAAVEATLGWAVSWRIGPGRLADQDGDALTVIRAALTVVSIGALLGLLGAMVGRG